WAKEPVMAVSIGIATLAMVSLLLSPYNNYLGMINWAMLYTYPVLLWDDGEMLDVPSHPCDKKGLSLEWLKNL
ncbi:NDUA3 dehydrogenase, partial [Pterocles burchelli]|nr:NDUA3 dehydrogenase [Pterocles burchelli]